MKPLKILSIFLFAFVLSACAIPKKNTHSDLFGSTWQLNYISGPRIAFGGLYPDKKPQISFNNETNKVEGSNSCNGYSADYRITGQNISFGEPGMSTMMYCGEGESVFLNTIKKINKYQIDSSGNLVLLIDDVAMMRFTKIN